MHRSVVVTSVAGDEQRLLEGEGLEMEGKASGCCSQVPGGARNGPGPGIPPEAADWEGPLAWEGLEG